MVINLSIPQSWNDLSETQFKNIAYQLECYHTLIKDTPQALENYTTALYLQVCKELLRHNTWKNILIALKGKLKLFLIDLFADCFAIFIIALDCA